MARKRTRGLSMRKIREILRLSLSCNMGQRQIARSCSISHATVSAYLKRVKEAGLSYSQLEDLNDTQLENILKGGEVEKDHSGRPQSDWDFIHQEMQKKGVTLQLLWQEYKEIHPDGYQSSQFYEHYNRWRKRLNVSLRQSHKAGEKMFVDYAGQTIEVAVPHTGKM